MAEKQCSNCKLYEPIAGDPAAGWCQFTADKPMPYWMDKYRSAIDSMGADVVATDGEDCDTFEAK